MTVCFIFVLSLNISLQNETYNFIKPAFVNPMSEGVQVVREWKSNRYRVNHPIIEQLV